MALPGTDPTFCDVHQQPMLTCASRGTHRGAYFACCGPIQSLDGAIHAAMNFSWPAASGAPELEAYYLVTADRLVALNNSSPRLPTRDAIIAVLKSGN